MKRSLFIRFRNLFTSVWARLRTWWQRRCAERERKKQLTLDEFMRQMEQFTRPGLITRVMSRNSGGDRIASGMEQIVAHMFAIYDSMAEAERADPQVIDGSRRRRIASGAGVRPIEVSQFINLFRSMRDDTKRLRKNGPRSLWRD